MSKITAKWGVPAVFHCWDKDVGSRRDVGKARGKYLPSTGPRRDAAEGDSDEELFHGRLVSGVSTMCKGGFR